MNKFFIIGLLAVLLFSCKKKSFDSESEYYKWMNDEKNGVSITKVINGYKLNVKYLSSEYVAYSSIKNKKSHSTKEIDSLLQLNSHSRTFLLTIGPDHENKAENDIMYDNVHNYGEYKERAHQLNFQIGDYIDLLAGSETFYPSLATLENIYSLGNQRSIYLVFTENESKELLGSEELDFVYKDELFDTGISHFHFKRSDLENIPAINFWKN